MTALDDFDQPPPDDYGAYDEAPPYRDAGANSQALRSGMGVRFSLVHRCLAWLIRHPEMAHELDLAALETLPEQEGKSLLTQVVGLLQEAPGEKLLVALKKRAPHAEYEALKQRINNLDPSLTKAEKQRFLELQKQRKQ